MSLPKANRPKSNQNRTYAAEHSKSPFRPRLTPHPDSRDSDLSEQRRRTNWSSAIHRPYPSLSPRKQGEGRTRDELRDYKLKCVSPIIVDLRINETLQTGAVRIPPLLFSRLVGTVSNSETAPTGGESVPRVTAHGVCLLLLGSYASS